ncbi:hypothetical protein, partial [uncultured Dialister sp.]|uniref:hypothetical protein n=1 Tax=uncultured Dialister sp. TaxID=278064 RepID=UPI0026728494
FSMPILYVIIFIPQKSVKDLFFDGEFRSPYDKKLSPSGESGAVRRRKGFITTQQSCGCMVFLPS